eukprot:4793863-Pyramimonas_sp.AAC.1
MKWSFSNTCPIGGRRSLRLNDGRVPGPEQFLLCDMCDSRLPDRRRGSIVDGGAPVAQIITRATRASLSQKRSINAN